MVNIILYYIYVVGIVYYAAGNLWYTICNIYNAILALCCHEQLTSVVFEAVMGWWLNAWSLHHVDNPSYACNHIHIHMHSNNDTHTQCMHAYRQLHMFYIFSTCVYTWISTPVHMYVDSIKHRTQHFFVSGTAVTGGITFLALNSVGKCSHSGWLSIHFKGWKPWFRWVCLMLISSFTPSMGSNGWWNCSNNYEHKQKWSCATRFSNPSHKGEAGLVTKLLHGLLPYTVAECPS